ncbi:hypothetical protein GCM10020001_061500 [Nonomuraea salmonea]
MHAPHRGGYVVDLDVLQQVAGGSRLDGLEEVLFLVAHREHDDPGARDGGLDALRGLDAVLPGHAHVHERDVGHEAIGQFDRLLPVARLTDHLDVRLRGQRQCQAPPDQLVIVHDQHADRLARLCAGLARLGHEASLIRLAPDIPSFRSLTCA